MPLDSSRIGAALFLLFSGCAFWAVPHDPGKIASDSRVGVVYKLAPGHVHLQVLVGPPCRAADEGPCPAGKPIPQLAVAAQTPVGVKELGTTWRDGGLDVPFATLDALFPNQALEKYERAPLLVEGRVVSDLPVAEIFRTLVAAAIDECDAALADPSLQLDYAQQLLGRMLDLQLMGLTDDKLVDRTVRLSMRVRERPAAMWSQPHKLSDRSERLIAGLRGTRDEYAVPLDVQRQLTQDPADNGAASSMRWALQWLSTVCKVGVKSGEFVGQVMLSGAPGIALAVLDATVGDVYSDWMIKSCCQRLSGVLGAEAPPPECASREEDP